MPASEIARHVRARCAADAASAGAVRLTLAGRSALLSANPYVAPSLLRTLGHLATTAEDRPSLTLRAARLREEDSDVLGTGCAPVAGIVQPSPDGRSVVHVERWTVGHLDRSEGRIDVLIAPAELPSWRLAKPLQLLLSIHLADRGIDVVHGAIVSIEGRGVLITGAGGSGKSTAALAAFLDGFDFLGDDCVAVDAGLARGYSLYGAVCIEHDHLPSFGGMTAFVQSASDKAVVALSEVAPQRVVHDTELVALVVPRFTGAVEVTTAPLAKRDALLALAPGSIVRRAVPPAAALSRMCRLVERLPCFAMATGPVDGIGPALRRLLEET